MSASVEVTRVPASPGVIFVLTMLTALGQFASNVYIAAIPAIAIDFAATSSAVQVTLTAFLLTFGLSQVVFGPISDRFGRKPLLQFGAVIYVVGSFVCVAATSIEQLIAGRIIQAVGAGAALVAARALVRDSFSGRELTRVLATLTIAFAAVPGFSPLVGGLLQDFLGWEYIFLLTGMLGIAALIGSLTMLPETHHHRLHSLDIGIILEGYQAILHDKEFMRFTMACALIMSAMSAFFAGAPVLFIEHLNVSPTEFGFYPPIAVTGFVIGGVWVRRFASALSPAEICHRGLVILMAGALIMLTLPMLGVVHKHVINLAIVVYVSGLGVFVPAATAGALQRSPSRAGSASALLGSSQMVAGGLATMIVSATQPAFPVMAFPAIMLSVTGLAAIFFIRLDRRQEHVA